jgi:hypothetical protein
MDQQSSSLERMLFAAEQRIAALESRLAKIEHGSNPCKASLDEVSSRRGLFKLAGAAATGAIVHTVINASPAAAADNSTFLLGSANNGNNSTSTTTTLTRSASIDGAALAVVYSTTAGVLADAIAGETTGSSKGAGVAGRSNSGFGVIGESSSGYAVYAGQGGRVGLASHITIGPPKVPLTGTIPTYDRGDVVRDASGNMYVCVVNGSPGSWRKIAGPASSGQFHFLSTPTRAYDSRASAEGPLTAGAERIVSLSAGVPVDSTGALLTLTITGTTGAGYLTLYATGSPIPSTSNVNWFGAAQSLASLTASAIDSSQRVTVRCGTGTTQFIVDIVGYYQ